MGFRTTVILYNDRCHEWAADPQLGQKISRAMNYANSADTDDLRNADLQYGRVVECAHADTQTLAVLDSYNLTPIARSHWGPNETAEQRDLRLLKEAADRLGYRLVKKPVKDAR